MKNFLKTTFFLTLLTLLFIYMGTVIGGEQGAYIAFGLAVVMNFLAYWFSDKIVLAMYHAKPATPAEAPQLYAIANRLAQQANIPVPKIYIIPTQTPNAFATGRDPGHAAVAATEGIMNMLSQDELEGVLAHELAHVKNRDILLQTIIATIAGAISILANMARWISFGSHGSRRRDSGNAIALLVIAIVVPLVAMLIRLAVSRVREYEADATGARICKKPLALASALEKLMYANKRSPMHASQATAHMFIVSPLSGGDFASLFSTHPPMEERIKRLRGMVGNV